LFCFVAFVGGVFGSALEKAFWYLIPTWVLLGLIQSVDFPSLVSTMSNWTNRGSRGFVSGVWSTCTNLGNIIGFQLGAAILVANCNQWNRLFYYVFFIYVFFAVAIYFTFLPSPKVVGLELTETMPEHAL
jgi:sugar phosphate permease